VRRPIEVFPDPRLLLAPIAPDELAALLAREGLDRAVPLIGVATRHLHAGLPEWIKRSHGYSDAHAARAYAALARALDALAEFAQPVLIPMHPDPADDRAAADAIRGRMRAPERLVLLARSYRSAELIGIIGACELVIAGRLGAAIFATAGATPVLGLAYEGRVIEHLERSGLGRFAVDWRAVDPDRFAALARELWERRAALRLELAGRAPALRQQARGPARRAAELLAGA
jgi:polysaccharide pyruvyl transferase WcaK-like protein